MPPPAAAVFASPLATGIAIEDAPHRLGSSGKEILASVCPIFPARVLRRRGGVRVVDDWQEFLGVVSVADTKDDTTQWAPRELNPRVDLPSHKQDNNLQQRQICVAASGQQMPCTACRSLALNDPKLVRVIQGWGVLPEPMKKAILALTTAASD